MELLGSRELGPNPKGASGDHTRKAGSELARNRRALFAACAAPCEPKCSAERVAINPGSDGKKGPNRPSTLTEDSNVATPEPACND